MAADQPADSAGRLGSVGAAGWAGRRPFGAIVLAGGRATRLGGADKPALRVGDRSLVGAVVAAARAAGASQLVVVSRPRPDLLTEIEGELASAFASEAEFAFEAEFVSEEPPGAGPVPALRAGLARVTQPWVLVLAADLPFLTAESLTELLDATQPGPVEGGWPGAVLVDDQARPQWLTSCWPVAELRPALAQYDGQSLRGLLGGLRQVRVTATVEPGRPPCWLDCDTPDDLRAAEKWVSSKEQP